LNFSPKTIIRSFGTFIKISGDFGPFRKGLIEASAHPPHTDIATIRPARRSAQERIIFVSKEAAND
jgi:hypothetical protein